MMNEEKQKEIESRLAKLEKSSKALRIEEKIVNFSLTLLSVCLSLFVIGVLVLFGVKLSG